MPASDIWPYVQDALDSLEFILGSPDSRWGSVRSSMGREQPWNITYVAIGNEDCGKWMYLNNYLAFFGALRGAHPHLRLISNCDMGRDAPTDIWDWHIYTNPRDLFNKRNIFDGRRPEVGSIRGIWEGGGWKGGRPGLHAYECRTERIWDGPKEVLENHAPLVAACFQTMRLCKQLSITLRIMTTAHPRNLPPPPTHTLGIRTATLCLRPSTPSPRAGAGATLSVSAGALPGGESAGATGRADLQTD